MKENKEETKLQSEQKTAEEITLKAPAHLSKQQIWDRYVIPQFKSQLPIEQKCSFQDQCDSEPLAYKEQFCGCHNHISQLKQEFVDYYVKRREYQNMEDSLRGMFDKFVLPHLLQKK